MIFVRIQFIAEEISSIGRYVNRYALGERVDNDVVMERSH